MLKNLLFLRIAVLTVFCGLFSLSEAEATHLRAGDLTAVRLAGSGLTYEFTITLYTDDEGVAPDDSILVNFGDKSVVVAVQRLSSIAVANLTHKNIYKVVHTFAGPGEYSVSATIRFRNANVLNIPNSDNTLFSIESTFLVSPFLGLNNSPILTIDPLDLAAQGQTFFHNPGAYDLEGDSLSYSLTICKKGPDGKLVDVYFDLDDPRFEALTEDGSGPATLTLDPYTGDLIWDAPNKPGEYNVAFYIDEWRDGVRIGRVNRDMQILVLPNPNKRPRLTIPEDTCVVAGADFEGIVSALDPDSNRVEITAFGELFFLNPPHQKATFDTLGLQPPNGFERGILKWQTSCDDIRTEPYSAIFRAKDFPIPRRNSLIDIKTWRIRVVGPAPDSLQATVDNLNKTVTLDWDEYRCANAVKMTVWRRIGPSGFVPGPCQTGLPDGMYTKLGENDLDNLSFTDSGELERGKTYCYRIYATFPDGSESIASEEICVTIQTNKPVITNVSVEKTDAAEGEIFVRWQNPIDADTVSFPKPYTYKVARASGFAGTANYTLLPGEYSDQDTFLTDKNLDTENTVYNYRIYFYSDTSLIDSSDVASSVWLTAKSGNTSITLNWQAEVPWNNRDADHPQHFIYREKVGEKDVFELIDSVNVLQEGYNYIDKGTFGGQPLLDKVNYCYVVQTAGRYENEKVLRPLLNKSQKACAFVADSLRPKIFMTNVSIEKTDAAAGEIFVRWTRPFSVDSSRFRPPYSYKLTRSQGFAGNAGEFVFPRTFNYSDTSFTDTGLNTADSVYNYRVSLYANDTLAAESPAASSVRLDAQADGRNAVLSWAAEVPWNNRAADFKMHYIYRSGPDNRNNFALIDSADARQSGFQYRDNSNLTEKAEYCYYVMTSGSYEADTLPAPLLNKSQEMCILTKDVTAPCVPELIVVDYCSSKPATEPDCVAGEEVYENRLNITPKIAEPDCPEAPAAYRIYYKRYTDDALSLLAETTDANYIHRLTGSQAGCYAVSAVDAEGNESEKSAEICVDNCPEYSLPNVITPNGDGKNDLFRPARCARFVSSMDFRVYNRLGTEVYRSTGDPMLDWAGTDQAGNALPGGMYYYEIRLTHFALSREDTKTQFNGWVTVLGR